MLRFRVVLMDFEAGGSWWEQLIAVGFDTGRPAVVSSTGVAMYLTKEAIAATLRQVATLTPGSTLAMSCRSIRLPPRSAPAAKWPSAARASGTPFVSLFSPEDMVALAGEAGFREASRAIIELVYCIV